MVSIVCSSIEPSEDFKKDILKSFGHPKVEFLFYENKGIMSLTEVYNKGLADSKYDIVVFLHDDITLETKQIANKLVRHYSRNPNYGILGVAGTKFIPNSGRWWEDRKKMYGRVKHTNNGVSWLSEYSADQGTNIEETIIVDGVFFSIHKGRIKHYFDEEVKGFHFYDIDFCFRNYLAGVKLGVYTDIRVKDKRFGETNEEWEKNRENFAKKFNDDLPEKIDRVFTGNECFRILIASNQISDVIDLVVELKNKNHSVSLCSKSDDKYTKLLQNKGIKFYDISVPPGYKLGDGQWGINTKNGMVPSEPNKYYKIKEIGFDILHITNYELGDHLIRFYPDTLYINQDFDSSDVDTVIEKYQKLLT